MTMGGVTVLKIYKDKGNQKDVVRANGTYYLLKFLNGKSYYQEDGSNGVTTVTKKAEVPYANGDANMNVYDQDFTDATFRKGGTAAYPYALGTNRWRPLSSEDYLISEPAQTAHQYD